MNSTPDLKTVVITFGYLDNWSHILPSGTAKTKKAFVRKEILAKAGKIVQAGFPGPKPKRLGDWDFFGAGDLVVAKYKGTKDVSDIDPMLIEEFEAHFSREDVNRISKILSTGLLDGDVRLPGKRGGNFASINKGAVEALTHFVGEISEDVELDDPTFGDRTCKIDYHTGLWTDSFSLDLYEGNDPVVIQVKLNSGIVIPVPVKVYVQWWENK